MCSIVLKVLFLGLLLGGIALTAVALATQYWRTYSDWAHIGLWRACVDRIASYCQDYKWEQLQTWNKAVIGLLATALFISLLAIGWWLLACIGCCCQNALTPPLPAFALLLALLDACAVIVYVCQYEEPKQGTITVYSGQYGYSFWCAVAATCCFTLMMLIGCAVVALARRNRQEHQVVYKEERVRVVQH